MLTQKECCKIIEEKLHILDLPSIPSNLYDPIRYILQLNAKRLRPSLLLMANSLFSDDIQSAINPALAIEVFHNFTLMHDDIMDNSLIRRNQQTVHVKWNENIAILSGDAMLIKAYELFTRQNAGNLLKTLTVFMSTALRVCEGQQLDMDYEKSKQISTEDYLLMISYKTAVLIAASLKIGALIGGASDQQADLLFEFGKNLGIAFQLQDDLMDIYGDPEVTGKAIGNDIVANKKTILLVLALSMAKGEQLENLLFWLNSAHNENEKKIEAVREIYNKLTLRQATQDLILNYFTNARNSLTQLNLAFNDLKPLHDLLNKLILREK